jgi:hypothetical protein
MQTSPIQATAVVASQILTQTVMAHQTALMVVLLMRKRSGQALAAVVRVMSIQMRTETPIVWTYALESKIRILS